jgi:hypothetical protein
MNTQQYAIATTEREIEQAYIDFRRMLTLGRSHDAVKQAIKLAKLDANTLWGFLLHYTSSEVNHRENEPVLVVNALWNNWLSTRKDVFIARAVLVVVNAPKTDSIAKFLP